MHTHFNFQGNDAAGGSVCSGQSNTRRTPYETDPLETLDSFLVPFLLLFGGDKLIEVLQQRRRHPLHHLTIKDGIQNWQVLQLVQFVKYTCTKASFLS